MRRKVLFVIGFLMLILPVGIRLCEKKNQESVVSTHWEQMEYLEDDELKNSIEEAREYNRKLFLKMEIQEIAYEDILNLSQNGMMGSIEIPKIGLKLPIYHGTGEDALTKGIGHMEESSLPVGGENVHSVLAGHRGIPSAQLFTRLDEIEKEDIFFVRVCDEVLTYEVKEVKVVKPEELDVLEIQEGRDLVSLITCTPYGLNTHRLIVMGERKIEQENTQTQEIIEIPQEAAGISKRDIFILLLPCIFLGIAIRQKIFL